MNQEELQKAYECMTFYMSISAIEKKLKMPATTLQKAMKGERELPFKWVKPVKTFFGIKDSDEAVAEVKPVVKKETATVATEKKTYTEYLRMSGDEIKKHWETIKQCKFTPAQINTLHSKKSK